jgi:two-component system response regulator FixJ
MTLIKRVYIVDDDDEVRNSTGFCLSSSGYEPHLSDCGLAFLDALPTLMPGCVMLDIRMPDIDGLQVIELMGERIAQFPVIFMTGHGDVATAVRAMKLGAVDFLEKPYEEPALTAAVERAFAALDLQVVADDLHTDACRRLKTLTRREGDVLLGLASGLQNKVLAYKLGLSVRTVEMHRSNMMTRLAVKSLPEALRLAYLAGAVSDTGTVHLTER